MPLQRTRINPVFPMVWENLNTLRIGFDTAQARIHDPSAAGQRLLSRLQRGIIEHTLSNVAAETGCTPAERDRIQFECGPVLITDTKERQLNSHGVANTQHSTAARRKRYPRLNDATKAPRKTSVAVLGNQKTRDRILRACEFRNFEPHTASNFPDLRTTDGSKPDLVIIVERFWAPPAALQCLVILGYPHISIRFSDQSVTIGPLVIPNTTPCGMCMQLADTQNDPVLPVLAAQLIQTVPATETPIVTDFAATVACHQWFANTSERKAEILPQFEALRFPVVAGHPRMVAQAHSYNFSPMCNCHASLATETGVSSQRVP